MANYFVDSTTGSDGDNGTTMDLAWATLDYALTNTIMNAGDVMFIRRGHNEVPDSGTINCTGGGYASNPVKVMGWPRAADASITSATWTQGSTTVDSIVGLTPIRGQHLGRFITGPDSNNYLITKLVSIDQGDNCKLLLHCDEVSFTDSSGEAHVVTMGDTVRSTTESQFGGYAAYFNGTSADLQFGDHTDWDLSSGDYTIDLWFWAQDGSGNQEIVTTRNGAATVDGLAIISSSGSIKYYLSSNASTWDIASATVIGVPVNQTWNHLRFTYDGTTYRGYLNGIEGNSTVSSTSVIDTPTLTFGSALDGNYFEGYMDEITLLREAVGSGDGNFSVPTSPYASTTAVLIDRKYVGATVTGVNGACTILADEEWVDDMGTAYGFDDSGWTIKESDWDADSDDLPLIDFLNNGWITLSSDHNWWMQYLELKGGANNSVKVGIASNTVFRGCLFPSYGNNANLYATSVRIVIDRCILTGDPIGGGGNDWGLQTYDSTVLLRNCAIYDFFDSPLVMRGSSIQYWENVNVGVEGSIGDDVFYVVGAGLHVYGRDVIIDTGSFDYFTLDGNGTWQNISFENFGKVLGAHFNLSFQGHRSKTDVVLGSGDPERRAGGNGSVLEILYDEVADDTRKMGNPEALLLGDDPIFTHEFEAPLLSQSYRYYVQAEGAVAADELWIEVEYVSSYTNDTLYYISRVASDEAITARSDAGDWSQYIEVTNILPAVSSKVRIKAFCRYRHLTNKIYIDPLVVIS